LITNLHRPCFVQGPLCFVVARRRGTTYEVAALRVNSSSETQPFYRVARLEGFPARELWKLLAGCTLVVFDHSTIGRVRALVGDRVPATVLSVPAAYRKLNGSGFSLQEAAGRYGGPAPDGSLVGEVIAGAWVLAELLIEHYGGWDPRSVARDLVSVPAGR
jgi:hypothetical protein